MKLEVKGNTYAAGEDAQNRPTEGVKILSMEEMELLAGELLRADYELFTDPALGGGQVFLLVGAVRQALVPSPESGLKAPGYFFHVQEIGKVPEPILEPPTTGLPPVNEGDVITIPASGEGKGDETPEPQPAKPEVIQPKEMGGDRSTRGPDEAEEPQPAKPEDLEPVDPNEGKGDEAPNPLNSPTSGEGDETPDPPKDAEGA